MDYETTRNTLGLVWIIGLFVLVPLNFARLTKKNEYEALLASGQKINLNLFTLAAAWVRKADDPLKASHAKIAKIGFMHFFGLVFGIVLGLFVIVILLRALF